MRKRPSLNAAQRFSCASREVTTNQKERNRNLPTYTTGHDETLPEGVYDFLVGDATERTSKSGNAPIELQLSVKAPGQKNGVRIFDHLVFTPKSYWKINAFRISTGETLVQGQTASFESEDCLDRTGKVRLMIEKYQGRDRNRVEEYIEPNAENPPPTAPPPLRKPSLEEEFGFGDDIRMK
jgi:hypothetical protein